MTERRYELERNWVRTANELTSTLEELGVYLKLLSNLERSGEIIYECI